MEMIEISGYVTEEKVEIAKRYLIPKQHEETGITQDQIKITDDSLTYLIDKHCRESGVRNLQKKIQRIFRKSAVKVVQGDKVRIRRFFGQLIEGAHHTGRAANPEDKFTEKPSELAK